MDQLVGVAFGTALAWLGNYIARRWAKTDKKTERDAARDEAHRNDLRRVYADFIAVYAKFLDHGKLMVAMLPTLGDLRIAVEDAGRLSTMSPENDRVYRRVLANETELAAKARENLHAFMSSNAEVTAKAVSVQLLDDEPTRVYLVTDLAAAELIGPQVPEDDVERARFLTDLKKQEAKLDDLRKALAGAFSPRRWDGIAIDAKARPPDVKGS